MQKLKYVELFAGCGGLSLGLESAGWELEFANELSPMAAETFAYNLLGVDIESVPVKNCPVVLKIDQLKTMALEDWINKKLIVGDVVELVQILRDRTELLERLKNVDLISGGPPCQGFSMAGRRSERDHKNRLPYAFVDFVELIKPKAVILENVEGILRKFTSDGGNKEPWLEIAKSFAFIGYAPICLFINAKSFGIPQNRPRFIMLGLRKDLKKIILEKIKKKSVKEVYEVFTSAFSFAEEDPQFIWNYNGNDKAVYVGVVNEKLASFREMDPLDIFKESNFFPEFSKEIVSVMEAINDLSNNGNTQKDYVLKNTKGTDYSNNINHIFSKYIKHPDAHLNGVFNHEVRKHKPITINRFVLLQESSKFLNKELRTYLQSFLKGEIVSIENIDKLRLRLKEIPKINEIIKVDYLSEFMSSLRELRSKKQIQRPLMEDSPAPAQLTIPDDFCHYSSSQPRVLTVREMARIQSFPDSFVFKSKVTTGGKNRKSEVPQYTQVGNAVPPILGNRIGEWVKNILK